MIRHILIGPALTTAEHKKKPADRNFLRAAINGFRELRS
jgi:hypothetical protein